MKYAIYNGDATTHKFWTNKSKRLSTGVLSGQSPKPTLITVLVQIDRILGYPSICLLQGVYLDLLLFDWFYLKTGTQKI